jgi:hypothetical protein
MKFNAQFPTEPGLYLYAFDKKDNPRQHLIIFWTSELTKPFAFHANDQTLHFTDLKGISRKIRSINGVFSFIATPYPAYISGIFDEFTLIESPSNIDPLENTVVAGDSFTIDIDLPSSQGCQINIDTPQWWQVKENRPSSTSARLTLITSLNTPNTMFECPLNIVQAQSFSILSSVMVDIKPPLDISIKPRVNTLGSNRAWNIEINLHNNSQDQEFKGRIVPLSPDSWAEGLQPIGFNELKPLADTTLYLSTPGFREGAYFPISFQVEIRDDWKQEFRQYINLLAAQGISEPVDIDGAMDEWQDGIPFYLDTQIQAYSIDEWRGTDDISGTGYLKWDENYIYLCVKVRDDIFSQPERDDRIWKGDSVQFALDFQRNQNEVAKGHHEIGFALCGEDVCVWRWLAPHGMEKGNFNHCQASITTENDTTIYEIAIPWHALLPEGRAPEPGEVFGFSLIINDNDGDGRRGWIEYMKGIGRTKDPNLFGEGVFVP